MVKFILFLLLSLVGIFSRVFALTLSDGDIALAKGEYAKAIAAYTEVYESEPTSPYPLSKRAAAHLSFRQPLKALRDLDLALELDSQFVQGLLSRGKLYRQLCRFGLAVEDFSKVRELRPSHKSLDQEVKKTLRARQQFEEVERLFRAVKNSIKGASVVEFGSDPDVSDPPEFLPPESSRDFQSSLSHLYSLSPDCLPAQILETRIQIFSGAFEDAISTSGRILRVDDRSKEALVLRGRAYFLLDDSSLAKRHFAEALNLDPDDADARQHFMHVKKYDKLKASATTLLKQRNWVEAEQEYARALNVDMAHVKGNVGLWFGICRARYRQASRSREGRAGENDPDRRSKRNRVDNSASNRDGDDDSSNNNHDHIEDSNRDKSSAKDKLASAIEACEAALLTDSGIKDAKIIIIKAHLSLGDAETAKAKANRYMNEHQGDRELYELYVEAEKVVKIATRVDYYATLGVEKNAGDREIKKAYRELAKKYHPDKVAAGGRAEARAEAEASFRKVAAAYEILIDPERRQRYDNGEDDSPSGGGGEGGGGRGFPGGGFPGGGFPGGGFPGGGFPGGHFHFQF